MTAKCPSVYLKTFGCQMNERDSELILGLMQDSDFEIAQNHKDADIILFNTCSVRKHAEDKVWSAIGALKNKKQIVGIVGCMAQNYKDDIFKYAPKVDFVAGPSDIGEIPLIIKRLTHDFGPRKLKINETHGIYRTEEIYHTNYLADKDHAYVVISEGCSNYCSYCVVPFVRGHLRSRAPQDILDEIERRIKQGVKNITLLGQNVNAYKFDSIDFVKLLSLVNSVKGLKSFNFITSHPKDTKPELFTAMRSLRRIKKILHLPIQSGSNRILKLMSRQYTKEHYLKLINEYKRIVGGKLATDFIVGFPSETEKDFSDSLDLLRNVEFDFSFIFKYSPRPHTKASSYEDDVSIKEKQRRHKLMLEEQRRISKEKH